MTPKYVKFNKDQPKLCLWEEWVDVQTQGGKDKGPYLRTLWLDQIKLEALKHKSVLMLAATMLSYIYYSNEVFFQFKRTLLFFVTQYLGMINWTCIRYLNNNCGTQFKNITNL